MQLSFQTSAGWLRRSAKGAPHDANSLDLGFMQPGWVYRPRDLTFQDLARRIFQVNW